MRAIKKWMVVFLMLGMGFSVSSPNLNVHAKNQTDRISIVTTLPIVKNIVDKIGGDQVRTVSIIQGIRCDHEYEPSPHDMKQLNNCSLFIKIGMGSDPWSDKLAAGALNKKALFVDPSKGVRVLKVRGLPNPHYWGDPDNVKVMAKNILAALTTVAPQSKAAFQSNYLKFAQDIDRTTNRLKTKVTALKNKRLVSYTGAFPYFYQYFGFNNLMTVEPSCEQEVSPKDMIDAAKLIKKQKIQVIVGDAAEPTEPDGLVKETKVKKVLLWATVDQSGDYLTTLRHNVDTLVAVLK